MWHLIACKISVSLSFLKWNDFCRISELMLATFIQRYDKKIVFDPVQKRETNLNFTGCQMPHFFYCIYTVYQFIKPFLDLTKKLSIFEKYGAFIISETRVRVRNNELERDFYGPVDTAEVMSSRSFKLHTHFLGRLSS